jgi:septal ring factor EnvC (AmiA/AmiB activator)
MEANVGSNAAIKQIVSSLLIGLLIGTFAGYSLLTKHDDGRMKELESNIETLKKNLAAEQDNAKKSLAELQAVEDRKKIIDQKIKRDFDELRRTNTEVTDVVKRLKVQVTILRKVLCDYSGDFCAQPVRDNSGTSRY